MSNSELKRFTDACRHCVNVSERSPKVPNDSAFIDRPCKTPRGIAVMSVRKRLMTLATSRRFHPKSPKAGVTTVQSYTDGRWGRSSRLTKTRAASNSYAQRVPNFHEETPMKNVNNRWLLAGGCLFAVALIANAGRAGYDSSDNRMPSPVYHSTNAVTYTATSGQFTIDSFFDVFMCIQPATTWA